MNILLTGGAGFIGSHIADAYLAGGHRVTILDNLSTGRRPNVPAGAVLVEVDIRDQDAVRRVFASSRFDLVNHHAAQMDVRKSVADPIYDASVNILGVLTLLQECVQTGVRRVLFASSGGAVYGEQEAFPADESHATRPISPYGVAKLTTEQYLFYYHAVFGLDAVCLRYANVFGPRQNPEGEAGVVAIFSRRLLRTGFQVFNIGTGRETDVNQIFHGIREAVGSACPERHGGAKKGEQRRSVLSSSRIQKALGWKPAVTLEEGLRRTVEYFRQNAAGRE
ncbi:MAG: NAD-dependent epimerase/dehydratase [Bacteroidetes bacterium]|nr:NAD-dependent epimerase/dehydratase [Bacteroidota bacterium]